MTIGRFESSALFLLEVTWFSLGEYKGLRQIYKINRSMRPVSGPAQRRFLI